MRKWITAIILPMLFLVGCTNEMPSQLVKDDKRVTKEVQTVDSILEDKRIYENDKPNSIVHLYVTVLNQEDPDALSFYELNHWYENNSNRLESPILNVIVQEGDENGPKEGLLGYGSKESNATIGIRGQSSKLEVQKSYKIKLQDQTGLWNGQKILNLNKHVADFSRVKNKLSFDYIKQIPELPSIRTQFVHLHIKDQSTKDKDKDYKSYGLYTHVEQINERYLSSHGLNPYGHLYKAINFEFRLDETKLLLEDDPNFVKENFESVLEIKGNNDHSKLIEMLKDLRNHNKNINELIEHYFDRDNLLAWMAINILFGNIDTEVNNYYLYSPPSSEKWYFIPWDFDKAWGWHTDIFQNIPMWQTGVARYWGTELHKRFLKDPNNLQALSDKIEELSSIITETKTEEMLNGYLPFIKPLVSQSPDVLYYPTNIKNFNQFYKKLIDQPLFNKKVYYEQLDYPMPVFLGEPLKVGPNYTFDWDHSYHLKGEDLRYTFQLAKDLEFKNIIVEKKELDSVSTTVDKLVKGRYFWRVLVTDEDGHQQIPYDFYKYDGDYYWGLKELIIK